MLYFFEVTDEADLHSCRLAYHRARQAAPGRSFAKIWPEDRRFLYVGSTADMATRLEQHLGFGSSPKTYALQLAHWAADLDLPLALAYAASPIGLAPAATQALEDALWDKLQPMFGRRGAR
jgi:hypothetical protein